MVNDKEKPHRTYIFRRAIRLVNRVVLPFLEPETIDFHIMVGFLHVCVNVHEDVFFFGIPFLIAVRIHMHVIPFDGQVKRPGHLG